MNTRGRELVENGVGIDHPRPKSRTSGRGKDSLGGGVLENDVKGWCGAGSLVDPGEANGDEIVLEGIF